MLYIIRSSMVAEKYYRLLRLYCVLMVALWSVLLQPSLRIEKVSFFGQILRSFIQAKEDHIYVQLHPSAIIKAAIYSAVALVGYYEICSRAPMHSRLRSQQRQMALVRYGLQRSFFKYFWICLAPWLFVFGINWVRSAALLLLHTLNASDLNVKNGLFLTIVLIYIMQVFVFLEVLYQMLYGVRQMIDIDERLLQRHIKREKLILEAELGRRAIEAPPTKRSPLDTFRRHTDGGGDADVSDSINEELPVASAHEEAEPDEEEDNDYYCYSVGEGWGRGTHQSGSETDVD